MPLEERVSASSASTVVAANNVSSGSPAHVASRQPSHHQHQHHSVHHNGSSPRADPANRRKDSVFDKKHRPNFLTVKIFQLLCAVYIVVVTFSHPPIGVRDPATGNIIDVNSPDNTAAGVIYWRDSIYRPIVAQGTWQLLCLAVSRVSAFSMYPPTVLVFLTKCKTLINWLETTPASMYMLKDFHELHAYCGVYIAYDVLVHTLFHILRYASQGNLYLVANKLYL